MHQQLPGLLSDQCLTEQLTRDWSRCLLRAFCLNNLATKHSASCDSMAAAMKLLDTEDIPTLQPQFWCLNPSRVAIKKKKEKRSQKNELVTGILPVQLLEGCHATLHSHPSIPHSKNQAASYAGSRTSLVMR